MAKITCSVDGCERDQRSRQGLCNLHWQRLRRLGSVRAEQPALVVIRGSLEDRFWPRVDKAGPIPDHRPELGPCWVWTGGHVGKGYGSFNEGSAHRFAYELLVGPIPEGLTLDHLCRVHSCVNPGHLEAVTNRQNVLRGVGPSAINARRTHCIHGHDLSDAYVVNKGWRRCRTCDGARYQRRRHA